MNMRDRYRGSLLGMAAGDAVGTTIEFEKPGTLRPLTRTWLAAVRST